MGDPVHHLVFANPDAVETWFEEKDLEGVDQWSSIDLQSGHQA
jgi:hypothetical protein